MKQLLLLLMLVFLCDSLMGQNIERVAVNGFIFADNNDVESVTVFNTSSNKGTITNSKGEFTIKVALNDVVEVSALQFKAVSITITKDVLTSKLLKIYLAEHINQLDAVLLSSGLSGNLVTDIDSAKELPKLQLDLGNMNALEYFDDKAFDNDVANYELNKITNKGGLYNGVDLMGLVLKPIFGALLKSKKKKSKNNEYKEDLPKDILDVYSHKFISETYNIPIEKVELFIVFLEEKGIKRELYKTENEIYLIEFLTQQSKYFLRLKDEKH